MGNPWKQVVRDLLNQIFTDYTYHAKMEFKHLNNGQKWLEHSDAKARCENLVDKIQDLLTKHGLELED